MKRTVTPILSPDRPGGFLITDRALEFCQFPPGAALLDIGCGNGASVEHIRSRHGLRITGLDADREKTGLSKGLICASALHIPSADAAFEGVLMECSLSVMDKPDAVLSECRRVLKPRGWLIISDVYSRGRAARFDGRLARLENRETIEKRLSDNGFRVELFQDFSEQLRAIWGQMIFDRGLDLCCADFRTDKATLKAVRTGYSLFVSRKDGPA